MGWKWDVRKGGLKSDSGFRFVHWRSRVAITNKIKSEIEQEQGREQISPIWGVIDTQVEGKSRQFNLPVHSSEG
jgi:hypothetical protein